MASDSKPLVVPTVHLNGSGKPALLEQLKTAAEKANDLLDALRAGSPHGRDYYLTPGAFEIARDQALAREKKVQEVLSELTDIYFRVNEQGR